MTWFLTVGLVLIAASILVGSRWNPRRRIGTEAAAEQPQDAWDVITKPVQRDEVLIEYPTKRSIIHAGNRRFVQGLLLGMGVGLVVGSLALWLGPGVGQKAEPPVFGQPPLNETAPTPTTTGGNSTTPPTTPKPAETKPKPANITFVVASGEFPTSVAAKLKVAGLIQDEEAFLKRLTERDLDTHVKAGTFIIPTNASLDTVIDALAL